MGRVTVTSVVLDIAKGFRPALVLKRAYFPSFASGFLNSTSLSVLNSLSEQNLIEEF